MSEKVSDAKAVSRADRVYVLDPKGVKIGQVPLLLRAVYLVDCKKNGFRSAAQNVEKGRIFGMQPQLSVPYEKKNVGFPKGLENLFADAVVENGVV